MRQYHSHDISQGQKTIRKKHTNNLLLCDYSLLRMYLNFAWFVIRKV